MRRDQMLDALHGEGVDADADFNDGIDPMGWFGWRVDGDLLSITFTSSDHVVSQAQWQLVPVEGRRDA